MAENKNIEVGGRLHSIATGNVLAGANEIFDDDKNKKQNDINTETYSLVNDINERLSGLSPDQQSALNVTTKATNNETKLGYYVCGTEGDLAAKVISDATGYILSKGGSMKIKMTNANTAANATLNINSTGAKPLYYGGERATSNNSWEAGETVEVYYDGTSYYANSVAGGSSDGVFDISAKTGDTYETLSAALAAANTILSTGKKKGGMSIKFIQLTPAAYTVVKTEGATEQPTGTEIQSDPGIISGTYTAGELSVFSTLPATLNSSLTYYLTVTETVDEQEVTTYTTWVITYVRTYDNKYVQYRLTNSVWSSTVSDWQGVDDNPTAGSNNLVKSGGIKSALNEIKSYIFEETSFNVYFKKNRVVGPQNTWMNSPTYSTGYINIPEGVTQIKIIPTAGSYLIYYFLTDLTITDDNIPYFVENYESRLRLDYETNEPQLIDIPAGTKYYCWVNAGYAESKLLCYYHNKDKIETNAEEIRKLNNAVTDIEGKLKFYSPIIYTLSMFKDFGVIGASRDSGYIYTAKSGGTPHNFNHLSWGANVCRLNGINFHCYAFGGANTRTWLSSTDINKTSDGYDGKYGKAKLLSDSPCNLYHIALGTNDVKLGIDYIGNITDINDDSPDETPDTFYGNYCKIVNTVKNHAPNAKIVFCMIRYSSSHTTTETREAFYTALKNIANHYSCPFIDFDDDLWYWEDMALDKQWGTHPTAAQLTGMALSYERLFSKCVEENYNYFADLQYIL